MTVLDTIRGMLGEVRSGLAELGQIDERQRDEIHEVRRGLAAANRMLDEQRAIIAKLRSSLEGHETELSRTADVLGEQNEEVRRLRAELTEERERAGIAQAGLDKAALMLGEQSDPKVAIALRGVHPSNLTDVLTVADDDRREAIEHVRALLGILDAIGGYMPSDYQAAIRAAREAVADG